MPHFVKLSDNASQLFCKISNTGWGLIISTRLWRIHILRTGIFLRWNSSLQWFISGKISYETLNNILGQVALTLNNGFFHFHMESFIFFCTIKFTFFVSATMAFEIWEFKYNNHISRFQN